MSAKGPNSPAASNAKVLALVILVACGTALGSCGKTERWLGSERSEPVTITFSCLNDWHSPAKVGPEAIAEFTRETGTVVKTLPYGEELAQRRAQHIEWLENHSSTPDVYQTDIIELPGIAQHMMDLSPFVGEDVQNQMPVVLKNFMFDSKLIAVPNNTDVGLLFYRKDLLKKYGYSAPPQTWDELTKMAAVIQANERAAGNKDFWGFAWEGDAWEGLTYTALEWQASYGGGHIIEPDGTISVNNPQTIAALKRARSWVGTISPPGVTAYRMEDVLNIWQAGRVAFIRAWPYVYILSNRPESVIKDKFDVTYLPSGGAGHTGTLGGWQFSVSKYSAHPREAAEFVKFLTSRQSQLRFTRELGWTPTRSDLYDDPNVLLVNPYFRWLKDSLPRIAVARPAGVARKSYTAVSDAYAQAVHSVLTGEQDPANAMAALEKRLSRLEEDGNWKPVQRSGISTGSPQP